MYVINNAHKLNRVPAFLKGSDFENVTDIIKKLNRTKMEELMDYFCELHQRDLEREAEERVEERGMAKGRVEGMAEGRSEERADIIRHFLSVNPDSTIQETAKMLGVSQKMIKSVWPE